MRRRAKYCSDTCREIDARGNYHVANATLGISPGTVGAMGELLVSVDLMRRGYDVFRALSPNCACDLAVVAAEGLIRIEVRTGYRSRTGSLHYSHNKPGQECRYDIMAVVLHDGTITYLPELPAKTP